MLFIGRRWERYRIVLVMSSRLAELSAISVSACPKCYARAARDRPCASRDTRVLQANGIFTSRTSTDCT